MSMEEPVSPLCAPCLGDIIFVAKPKGCGGLCCGGFEVEADIARDEDAVFEDVVVGLEPEGEIKGETQRLQ